jgi:hypothetical protein
MKPEDTTGIWDSDAEPKKNDGQGIERVRQQIRRAFAQARGEDILEQALMTRADNGPFVEVVGMKRKKPKMSVATLSVRADAIIAKVPGTTVSKRNNPIVIKEHYTGRVEELFDAAMIALGFKEEDLSLDLNAEPQLTFSNRLEEAFDQGMIDLGFREEQLDLNCNFLEPSFMEKIMSRKIRRRLLVYSLIALIVFLGGVVLLRSQLLLPAAMTFVSSVPVATDAPTEEGPVVASDATPGFGAVQVPEPSTGSLLCCGLAGVTLISLAVRLGTRS